MKQKQHWKNLSQDSQQRASNPCTTLLLIRRPLLYRLDHGAGGTDLYLIIRLEKEWQEPVFLPFNFFLEAKWKQEETSTSLRLPYIIPGRQLGTFNGCIEQLSTKAIYLGYIDFVSYIQQLFLKILNHLKISNDNINFSTTLVYKSGAFTSIFRRQLQRSPSETYTQFKRGIYEPFQSWITSEMCSNSISKVGASHMNARDTMRLTGQPDENGGTAVLWAKARLFLSGILNLKLIKKNDESERFSLELNLQHDEQLHVLVINFSSITQCVMRINQE